MPGRFPQAEHAVPQASTTRPRHRPRPDRGRRRSWGSRSPSPGPLRARCYCRMSGLDERSPTRKVSWREFAALAGRRPVAAGAGRARPLAALPSPSATRRLARRLGAQPRAAAPDGSALEAKDQLAGRRASARRGIASCGGANLGGISSSLAVRRGAPPVAVEPSSCPTLTEGRFEYDFGDTAGMTPLLHMYTLGHDFMPPTIHAGGLRYHGDSPIVRLCGCRPDGGHRLPAGQGVRGGQAVRRRRGQVAAPEAAHAIRAAIDEALAAKETGEEKVILFNYSGHGSSTWRPTTTTNTAASSTPERIGGGRPTRAGRRRARAVPSPPDVREDLRDHQRGRRALRRSPSAPTPSGSSSPRRPARWRRTGPRHRPPAAAGDPAVGVFRDERPERVVEIVQRAGSWRRSSTATRPRPRPRGSAQVPFVIKAFAGRRSPRWPGPTTTAPTS